jgi:hypothetical protein
MIIVICPHCKDPIIIEKINCGIFRHGEFKNGKQIDPHLSKEMCDKLIKNKSIYGCGKPFKIISKTTNAHVDVDFEKKIGENDNNYEAIICEYI